MVIYYVSNNALLVTIGNEPKSAFFCVFWIKPNGTNQLQLFVTQ